MSREEQLKFCEICKNHDFDYQKGIICNRTGDIADFQSECEYFQADETTTVNERSITGEIRDNSKRAKLAISILIAITVMNVIAVISGYFEFELLERITGGGSYSETEAYLNDLRQGVIALIQGILYISSAVIFLKWFRRAYWNTHMIAYVKPEFEENMAVWSFVIPLVNLYMPYKIVKEIINALKVKLSKLNPDHFSSISSSIHGYWWALFLLTNYIGQIALRIALADDGSTNQLMNTSLAYLISDTLEVPAAVITAVMIKQISADESVLYEKYRIAGGGDTLTKRV